MPTSRQPLVVSVAKVGKDYIITDSLGKILDNTEIGVPEHMLRKAVKEDCLLKETLTARGTEWRRTPRPAAPGITSTPVVKQPVTNLAFTPAQAQVITPTPEKPITEIPTEHSSIIQFVHTDSYGLKPAGLVMNELKWKYLMRTAIRGKNIMMTGDSGSGKTLAAISVPKALNRPWAIFNMGADQDPQSFLIGNTHYSKDSGTYFSESEFVKMIRIPNSIVILDEISRSEHSGWNILMSTIDVKQRYLRLDQKDGSEVVKVADGVTFISTANIGNQYTATNKFDRAFFEQWNVIEMDLLTLEQEKYLLGYTFPDLPKAKVDTVAELVVDTRIEMQSDTPQISRALSTRDSIEVAGLLYDGFKLEEAAEVAIYPFYEKEGNGSTERQFLRQAIQKYISIDDQTSGAVQSSGNLFPQSMINQAPSANNP